MRLIFVSLVLLSLTTIAPAASAKTIYWASFAKEMTDGADYKSNATITIGFSRKETRAEAESTALKLCRESSSNPQKCQTLDTYGSGCSYVAIGKNPWGQAGYASADTPQKAYDQCRSGNLNCAIPVFGGCADSAQDISRSDIVPASKVKYWAALAAGTASNGSRNYVSTGKATGPTRASAEAKAVALCNDSEPNVTCKAVGAFDGGCGYIAIGYKSTNGSGLSWGTGRTPQQAYDNCQSGGVWCRTEPMGHCIDE